MARKVGKLLNLVRSSEPDDPERGPVIDAALESFIDFGVRRTSMGEIAKRAGLSPATLYRRFAQKSDVVQAVGLREVQRFIATVERRIDHDASAEDQIVEVFVAFSEGLRRHKLLQRLLDTEPEIVLPLLTVRGGPVLALGRDYLAEFVARLQSEGKLPPYDPEPLAEMFARVALSLALIPESVIPLGNTEKARAFARDHIAAMYRFAAPDEAAAKDSA